LFSELEAQPLSGNSLIKSFLHHNR